MKGYTYSYWFSQKQMLEYLRSKGYILKTLRSIFKELKIPREDWWITCYPIENHPKKHSHDEPHQLKYWFAFENEEEFQESCIYFSRYLEKREETISKNGYKEKVRNGAGRWYILDLSKDIIPYELKDKFAEYVFGKLLKQHIEIFRK